MHFWLMYITMPNIKETSKTYMLTNPLFMKLILNTGNLTAGTTTINTEYVKVKINTIMKGMFV